MTDQTELPNGLLLAFYGDDFTGSSAVMEVMTFAGLPAVMFVETPTKAQLERFSNYRAIGIASVARAQPPGWMDARLPGPSGRWRNSRRPSATTKSVRPWTRLRQLVQSAAPLILAFLSSPKTLEPQVGSRLSWRRRPSDAIRPSAISLPRIKTASSALIGIPSCSDIRSRRWTRRTYACT